MSDTIVDMPKVTQALDAGWRISLFKNDLGAYTVRGRHKDHPEQDTLVTDDFTPEQALTRFAYKAVDGVIL